MKNETHFIFDTETNGLNDCGVLSLSFIICKNHTILKQDTRYYYAKEKSNFHAIKVNGLTDKVIEAKREKSDYPLYFEEDSQWLIEVMNKYKIDTIVSHNTGFDLKFLPSEIQKKISDSLYDTFCTMKNNTTFVGIKKGNRYKFPSLKESCGAYGIPFDLKEAHQSDYDTLKAYEVFVATMKRLNE